MPIRVSEMMSAKRLTRNGFGTSNVGEAGLKRGGFPVSEHGVWNSNPDVRSPGLLVVYLRTCLAEIKGFQLLIQRALGDA
jgi:hypothetical protein